MRHLYVAYKLLMRSQLLPKKLSHHTVFTSNVQCVRLAAGRRTQAGDATDQWRDH